MGGPHRSLPSGDVHAPASQVFGELTEGWDVLEALANSSRARDGVLPAPVKILTAGFLSGDGHALERLLPDLQAKEEEEL